MIPQKIITPILSGYPLPTRGTHGIPHWSRVLETALRLAEHTGADPQVVTLFSVFHDARRLNEGTDPDHGRRGADLALQLRPLLEITDPQLEQLTYACIHHTEGLIDADPTVQTCWDADRLDLWRVGITPLDSQLCTDAARDPEIQAWARGRSLCDHRPECATEWLRIAAGDGFD
jgi:uncharacterized protein